MEDLLKVPAHRPRPEDSAPTGFRRNDGRKGRLDLSPELLQNGRYVEGPGPAGATQREREGFRLPDGNNFTTKSTEVCEPNMIVQQVFFQSPVSTEKSSYPAYVP